MHRDDQLGKGHPAVRQHLTYPAHVGDKPVDVLGDQIAQCRIKFAAENLHELGPIEAAAVGEVEFVQPVPMLEYLGAMLLNGVQDGLQLLEFRVPEQMKMTRAAAPGRCGGSWFGVHRKAGHWVAAPKGITPRRCVSRGSTMLSTNSFSLGVRQRLGPELTGTVPAWVRPVVNRATKNPRDSTSQRCRTISFPREQRSRSNRSGFLARRDGLCPDRRRAWRRVAHAAMCGGERGAVVPAEGAS